jgi:outer membrane receptor protein involved in Fe transport
MRLSVAVTAVCLSIIGLCQADDVRASMIRKPTNIPAQGLGSALQTLAKDRNFQIVYVTEEVNSLRTQGAVGEFTPDEALRQLLKGTALTYRYLDEKTVTIVPVSSGAVDGGSTSPGTQPSTSTSGDGQKEELNPTAERFLVAQAAVGQAAGAASVDTQAEAVSRQVGGLQEVLVTAQKRTERIQDVPVPVTAISADTLISNNQLLLRDMFSSFPSFSLGALGAQGQQYLGIRGINTGDGNPGVGITVDDAPYGSSTNQGGGESVPDIDPNDLARVEVLRGPQGTLYGASSLGGVIKYVTTDPSTAGLSGRVQAGLSGVVNGSELGYNVRGAVNVPLSDTVAVRLSGYTRRDPGYIDNIFTGMDGVNEVKASGGRLSALWQPSETLSLKLSAMYQTAKSNGSADVDVGPGLSGLQQNYIAGVGGYDKSVQVYTATLRAKLGAVNLTSVTGYNVNAFQDSEDYTYIFGTYSQMQFGVPGTPAFDDNHANNFSQEIRLSSSIGKSFEWLLGGFYTHQSSQFSQTISASDPHTGVIAGEWVRTDFPSTYQEIAGFTNLTWHFTEHFDVQVGGRYSSFKQTDLTTQTGIYNEIFMGAPYTLVYPTASEKADAFTYLVTPRYVFSPDLMLYARLASGYRPGGPNFVFGDIPAEYGPDKTQNYEIGFKGDFLGHALSIDASVYYIQWKNIQLSLIDEANFQGYIGNGSEAKSQGVELSVQSRPVTGMTLGGWVAFNDAVLTKDFPANSAAVGVTGDRLPYSSRWSGNLSVDQQFPLVGSFDGFVGATVSYVGDRLGPFQPTAQRQDFPSYTKTDLRAGIKDDHWTVNLFATNVADKRGVLSGGLGYVPPYAFIYIQPRTIGLSVSREF